jgi:hypothetical protein
MEEGREEPKAILAAELNLPESKSGELGSWLRRKGCRCFFNRLLAFQCFSHGTLEEEDIVVATGKALDQLSNESLQKVATWIKIR